MTTHNNDNKYTGSEMTTRRPKILDEDLYLAVKINCHYEIPELL